MRVARPEDLLDLAGTSVPAGEWVSISSTEIEDYLASSGDHDGTFAALSLVNRFLPELVAVERFSAGVNVGLDGATFGAPLGAGDRIRGSARVIHATEVGGGVQVTVEVTLEVEGRSEPACVANTVSRFFP